MKNSYGSLLSLAGMLSVTLPNIAQANDYPYSLQHDQNSDCLRKPQLAPTDVVKLANDFGLPKYQNGSWIIHYSQSVVWDWNPFPNIQCVWVVQTAAPSGFVDAGPITGGSTIFIDDASKQVAASTYPGNKL